MNDSAETGRGYDVIVIGGGPAGSTVAALVAEHGHRVLVLERSRFPRHHVGESLIPATWWTLNRLGVLDQLRASPFPKKYSVQFISDGIKESAPFYFDRHNPHESSQTWQVVRGEFDRMLLENAARLGAEVRIESQVLEVRFEGDQATGVRVRTARGGNHQDCEIPARVVVDATGQSAFLSSRLGLRKADQRLRKATIWTWFKGARRDTGRDEGATLIMQTEGKKSWFWYIPLPDNVVSVGCTASLSEFFGSGHSSAEQIFHRELTRCPALEGRLASATRCHDFLTTKDYSWHSREAAGPGWVLVGDAYGFIDPVYSTGVFLALKSGELAADTISDTLDVADVSAASLGRWRDAYDEGVDLFRRLVYAFYTPDFSFGQFLRQHPGYRSNLVDLLIGDIFKPGVGEIFAAMGEVLPPPEG